jgi:7,8-dihydroneopterin aldolase/epimerase/oxygenase
MLNLPASQSMLSEAAAQHALVHPDDLLRLEVSDVEISLLTGVYSEETHLPQPLKISVKVDIARPRRFSPDSPLSESRNYMDIRWAIDQGLPRDRHFTLIEAVADQITATIFAQEARAIRIEVKIVKLAISLNGEAIGLTMVRHRP